MFGCLRDGRLTLSISTYIAVQRSKFKDFKLCQYRSDVKIIVLYTIDILMSDGWFNLGIRLSEEKMYCTSSIMKSKFNILFSAINPCSTRDSLFYICFIRWNCLVSRRWQIFACPIGYLYWWIWNNDKSIASITRFWAELMVTYYTYLSKTVKILNFDIWKIYDVAILFQLPNKVHRK